MLRRFVVMLVLLAMVALLLASMAFATITFPTIVLTDYNVAVGVVLTGIGAIWVVRKFIKLGNRS